MNRDRAITLIIVLNFMIVLLLGVNYNVTKPTKINKIIANTYKTPANKAFTDQNFYNCVIDRYNSKNNTSLAYTTSLTNEQLASIEVFSCYGESITSTNGLELMTGLTHLYISSKKLTSLDVSKNLNLTYLDVSWNQLTSLDVSKNVNLTELNVSWNQLTSLDVRNNVNLTYLDAHGNQLTSLDVRNNVNLTTLVANYNQLMSLDVRNNVNLTYLEAYSNQLTSLDVSKNVNLTNLRVDYNQLMSLDVRNNVNLTWLGVSDNQLTSLDVRNNLNLIYLYADTNQLTSLDVSNNVNLDSLSAGTQLTSLDVSKNVNLTYLNISSKKLTSLDISNNVNLESLGVSSSQLTSLDVRNNVNLTLLGVSDNQLTSLDVSKNVNLTELYADNNQLTSLDVSKNVNLTKLYAYKNQLKSLDASKNVNLTYLDAKYNQITNLDVSGATNLTYLNASCNQLTSLDVSKNVNLKDLDAGGNQLTSLDVSKNVNLIELGVYKNQLTSLDVSNNQNLTTLVAYNNPYILGEEIIYKNNKIDLSNKINTENYKLNNNFTKEYKYSEINNTKLDNSIINNENVGKYDYKLYFKGDNNYNYNISGTYTVYVTELKSNKYKINEEKGYIYTGLDTNKETILSNLSTEYGTLEINDNKLQVKDGNNIIKEFKLLNLTSRKYKLNNDYIYTSVNEYNKDDINTECALNLKDNLIEVSYDNEVLDTFKLIRITNSKYKITDKYIYTVGNIDLNNINITNGNIKINNNKLEIIYNDILIDSLDILSIDFGTLKVSNNVIVIIKEIPYKEFTDEIKVSNVSYKIYKEEKEVTSGNIEKGMILKVISETYGIIEEYKITNEYIDVSKLNIDENNFINDFEVGDKYKNILDKIDTSGEIKIIDNAGKELTSNDNVRTGSKIRIELTTETKEYTVVVLGDVTGTGKITMADVMKTANYLLDNSVIKEECYKKAADVTKDENIKISDVMKLANYVLNGKF